MFKKQCENCPHRENCIRKRKAKITAEKRTEDNSNGNYAKNTWGDFVILREFKSKAAPD